MEPAETHPDRLIDFWEWLVENRRQVILAIFIAVGAVLIVYIKRQNEQLAEEAAGEDVLAVIDNRFSTEEVDPKSSVSERFAKVVLNHPDTAGASNAKFLQGSALFDEGEFKKADDVFAAYIAGNPQSPLRSAAALGQAACKASLNVNDPGAAAAYEAVRSQHAGTAEAVQATLALGRLKMAAKDATKAKELFTVVSTNIISPFWASEANKLLGQLPE